VGEVRVVYRKYDGSLHWNHPALRLGSDQHGLWLGVPLGTLVHKGEPEWGPVEAPFVLLMPAAGWWTATFNAEPHRTEIYCDITTVPHWRTPDEITMVDLDLDVRRRRAGQVELLDEDEFAEHRVRFGYPAGVVDAARAAAGWLFTAVRDRVEPFDTASAPWLARVTEGNGAG
jgi:protein associated with RNAse G/E